MCIQAATNRGYAPSDAADILSPACISGYLRHPEVFAIQVEKTLIPPTGWPGIWPSEAAGKALW